MSHRLKLPILNGIINDFMLSRLLRNRLIDIYQIFVLKYGKPLDISLILQGQAELLIENSVSLPFEIAIFAIFARKRLLAPMWFCWHTFVRFPVARKDLFSSKRSIHTAYWVSRSRLCDVIHLHIGHYCRKHWPRFFRWSFSDWKCCCFLCAMCMM